MNNLYKGLLSAALIIAVALIAKGAGVDKDISFGLITVISGFAAAWIARGATQSGERCAR